MSIELFDVGLCEYCTTDAHSECVVNSALCVSFTCEVLVLTSSAFYFIFILLPIFITLFLFTVLNELLSFPIPTLTHSFLICPVAYLLHPCFVLGLSLHPCPVLWPPSSAPPSEDPAPPLSEADELLNK